MSEWIAISEQKPGIYSNVLLAFADHWNPVVGFYCGKGEYYETSAHDNNSKIVGAAPIWWMPIAKVPHDKTNEPIPAPAESERKSE